MNLIHGTVAVYASRIENLLTRVPEILRSPFGKKLFHRAVQELEAWLLTQGIEKLLTVNKDQWLDRILDKTSRLVMLITARLGKW
jgi:hypothetical protein